MNQPDGQQRLTPVQPSPAVISSAPPVVVAMPMGQPSVEVPWYSRTCACCCCNCPVWAALIIVVLLLVIMPIVGHLSGWYEKQTLYQQTYSSESTGVVVPLNETTTTYY